MLDQLKQLKEGLEERVAGNGASAGAPLSPLRAVAAQLLLATGAGATLEQITARDGGGHRPAPPPLAWAPALIGPLAAAAQLAHRKQPSVKSAAAMRVLNGAAIGLGSALLMLEILSDRAAPRRLGPLALVAAGLLGHVLDRHEQQLQRSERRLRLRANVVERLVPRRRGRLDRIVVHV